MPRFVRWIWRACAIHFAIGLAAYLHFLITGSYRYLTWYFLILGTLFFLLTTAAELFLAFECRAGFDADEPMRMAWTFIALSSLARFVAAVLISLDHWRGASLPASASSVLAVVLPRGIAQAGEVIGGPLSMIFLVIALSRVLQVQRRFGVLGRLTRTDLLLIALIGAFTLGEITSIVRYLGPSYPSPPLAKAILWSSDPLLSLLLVQAVLIRRSVIRVGIGLVSQCWGMYVIAIVTTLAGDASIWAIGESLLSEPLIALTWYIWFFSAAAFASAPAYQLAAMTLPLHEGALRRH
ncbi:hypothetical protein P8935_20970 [Telmatobacter sp. DSM 110680]|uniref:Uncharacterized protein n=1 Tax=Telmatobacter sp. DSM 110680 TaxID=3036704 RepID=A0AAU7DG72_9BACT